MKLPKPILDEYTMLTVYLSAMALIALAACDGPAPAPTPAPGFDTTLGERVGGGAAVSVLDPPPAQRRASPASDTAIPPFPQPPAVATPSATTPRSTPATMSPEAIADREVLVALYNATGGPQWFNSKNWLTHQPVREWSGVEADEKGNVIGLFLGRNNLSGQIPRELGNLTDLEYLDLAHNDISGPVPSELGSLSALTYLGLGTNDLTGALPLEVSALSNLETLSIGKNPTLCIPLELQIWIRGVEGEFARPCASVVEMATPGIVADWQRCLPSTTLQQAPIGQKVPTG